jgi:hypothetical protein
MSLHALHAPNLMHKFNVKKNYNFGAVQLSPTSKSVAELVRYLIRFGTHETLPSKPGLIMCSYI